MLPLARPWAGHKLCMRSWGLGNRSYQDLESWCGSAEMQHLSVQTTLAHSKCQTMGMNSAHTKNTLSLRQIAAVAWKSWKVKLLNILRCHVWQIQLFLAFWLAWRTQQLSMLHQGSDSRSVDRTCNAERSSYLFYTEMFVLPRSPEVLHTKT